MENSGVRLPNPEEDVSEPQNLEMGAALRMSMASRIGGARFLGLIWPYSTAEA